VSADSTACGPRLRPGAGFFQVDELPAYTPSGEGEHLYAEIRKEGLNTDEVAERLVRAARLRRDAVGYAGRKDRHAVTTQWFSLHLPGKTADGDAELLATALADEPRLHLLQHGRHRNKLRTGHLRGNRFRLGLDHIDNTVAERLAALARDGLPNRYGAQRFGSHGAGLQAAAAWCRGDVAATLAWIVDARGSWRPGEALPEGFIPGPGGRVVGVLRRGETDPAKALAAGGEQLATWLASVAQSAVFNAILDGRTAAGLLHTLRPGDLAMTPQGNLFTVSADDLAAVNVRAAPGVLDALATGPLPGRQRLQPESAIAAEERAWAADTGIDWSALAGDGPLSSPGTRRPLIVPFHEAPTLHPGENGVTWLHCALPAGSYATEILAAAGIALPEHRDG
jgi:tRNA(Glu) U13 pseudouridine synthase TruD